MSFSHSTPHFYIIEFQSFQGVKRQEQQGFALNDLGKRLIYVFGEYNWADSIPNFNGVLTLEMTLERFEGRNTVTQLVKGVVTTLQVLLFAVIKYPCV
jgi:hypothetical protein